MNKNRITIRLLFRRITFVGKALALLGLLSRELSAQTIPANFFGINHWMPTAYIDYSPAPYGQADNFNVQTLVENAGTLFYRIGGDGYDTYGKAIDPLSTDNDYLKAMDAIDAANPNAMFLVQIPVKAGLLNSAHMDPTMAATLVANIEASTYSGRCYYSIGNEWDKYIDPNTGVRFTVADIKLLIRDYAVKMKDAAPNIKIVAPSVSYLHVKDIGGSLEILKELIGGSQDITMLISGSGNVLLDGIKYYIDVVNYHSYAGGSSTGDMSGVNSGNYAGHRTASVDFPSGNFTAELSTATDNLQSILDNANSGRGVPLTFAITEMNIDYLNPNLSSATAESQYENTPKGLGARSFLAGQYWVDMMGAILKIGTDPAENQVEFVMPWSIHESGGDGSSLDLGMTKGTASSAVDPTPLSTYWHYQMMATNFSGDYLLVTPSSTSTPIKAFAYENTVDEEIGFIIINQNEQSQPRDYEKATNSFLIGFGGTPSASADQKFSITAGSGISDYSCNLPKESTMLLIFSTASGTFGNVIRKDLYTLSHSLQDEAPTPVMTSALSITTQSALDSNAPGVYTTVTISPSSAISVGTATVNNEFRFTSYGHVDGDFTVSAGETFSLVPSAVCQ